MDKKMKKIFTLLILSLSFALIVACGSDDAKDGNNDDENNNGEPEEITIRWAHQWGEEHFEDTIGKYIKEEFPHITIDVQEAGTDHSDTLENLIAGKNSPDIVTMGLMTHTNIMEDLGLAYDMDELIEQEGFDLDRIEPSIIEFVRNQDPNQEGGLYGLLASRPTFSMHYNKDIFDKLGVEYPTDDMTWEEFIELAKELSMEMDGVQYRGLDLDVPYDAYTQFSQVSIDPETDEAIIEDSEAYRRYLDMIDEVVSIPGNYPQDDPASLLNNWGSFFNEGEIAMAPAKTVYGWLGDDNIDIVTYPAWEGYENIDPIPNGNAYAITDPSEHKEEALQLIAHILSDEVQMIKSKEGSPSTLVNQDIHDAFAEDKEEFQGKNLQSLFKHEFATGPEETSKYAGASGDGVIWSAATEFVESGKDVVEYLRILQEESEENIRTRQQEE